MDVILIVWFFNKLHEIHYILFVGTGEGTAEGCFDGIVEGERVFVVSIII